MKVRNYIPFAKPDNQLPRESRDLPWSEDPLPWVEHEEGAHWGDVAVIAACIVGIVLAMLGVI